ncbi:MAG: Hsp20/alpha crystallin family protein [Cyanobacteriota bacterium]|nr:Hsp20/alpha crystallin family protein [Cyanobacteriota bacterium]
MLHTPGVRAESNGTAHPSGAGVRSGDSHPSGDGNGSATATFIPATMRTLRSSSPFVLFDRLERQLSQQLHNAERVPAAEVHDTPEAYLVVLELPGVDKDAIEVKATDRTLLINAERRAPRQSGSGQPPEADGSANTANGPEPGEGVREPLLSEFRYGTWSRSFRFPAPIACAQLQAVYRDGLLTVTAPKAQQVSTVSVRVES